MTQYNVHLYRQIRLTFRDIEAASHEAAVAIARDGLLEDADEVADSDGADFTATVDVAGDDAESVSIDFESEKLRKAAPTLLAALQWFESAWRYWADDIRRYPKLAGNTEMFSIYETARAAIALATGVTPAKGYRPSLVVVSVRGGLVQEVRANVPVMVVVEDWDAQQKPRPAITNLEPIPLADNDALLISNPQQKG